MAVRLSGCHSVIFRHTHWGELAGNLVHRRIQILQLPQIQTAAANQPRSQVPLPAALTWLMFIFVLFAFIRQRCVGVSSHVCSHECHRQEILFSHRQPSTSFLSWACDFPSALATGRHLTLFCHLQAGRWRHRVAAFIPQSEWSSLHQYLGHNSAHFFLMIQHCYLFFSTFSLYWYYQTHNITIILSI